VSQVRDVARCLFDRGSFLELRAAFGRSLVTALARIKGIAVGLIGNDCKHNGGAIDSAAADKAAWLLRLCARFGLPVVSLCDTPGFMVGPASEAEGAVRRMCAMLVAGSEAAARVPWVTVVLRKAYGLGAQAMAAGSLHAPLGTFAWPMGEFGGMGLEGAVKLGFRKELDACSDELQRTELYKSLLAAAYERGKALNTARVFEIDDVIDPADTRQCVARVIGCSGHPAEPQWATLTSQSKL
jgi:acetyl-CoA carboxylase carboxyltransferase component